jgi:hypothetical protein
MTRGGYGYGYGKAPCGQTKSGEIISPSSPGETYSKVKPCSPATRVHIHIHTHTVLIPISMPARTLLLSRRAIATEAIGRVFWTREDVDVNRGSVFCQVWGPWLPTPLSSVQRPQ